MISSLTTINVYQRLCFFSSKTESMKVKKTDLPVLPPEDILPSLDDEVDESDMDDGKRNPFFYFRNS